MCFLLYNYNWAAAYRTKACVSGHSSLTDLPLSLPLLLSQPMGSACWSPLWRWPWWRWASQPCSTWCLALYSPAWRWRSGARSCPSSGLGVDLWWIPVWYECPLRIIPLSLSKKSVPQKSPPGHKEIYIVRNEVEIQVEWPLGCIFVLNDSTVPTDALCNPCPKPTPPYPSLSCSVHCSLVLRTRPSMNVTAGILSGLGFKFLFSFTPLKVIEFPPSLQLPPPLGFYLAEPFII